MPWLVRDSAVLASAEIAASGAARRKGLLGRDGIDGALVLRPCRQVHTLGMRIPIDVVWCGADGRVLRIARLGRHRLSRLVWRARLVIEAEAGATGRWGLRTGDVVEIREEHP